MKQEDDLLEENQKAKSKFVNEFLNTNPNKLVLTEIGTCLGDFIKAFTLLKEKGEIPSKEGMRLSTYQNCLFSVYVERNTKLLNVLN